MIINKRIFEIFIVCSISGITMLLSGSIIDTWKDQSILTNSDFLWVLITPLIGLKGNIEMTMASRLSTLIKLGHKYYWRASIENLMLVQIQGVSVGFMTGLIGSLLTIVNCDDLNGQICLLKCLRLVFITTVTASITCLLLGIVTVLVVRSSLSVNMDPDNISSPLAAALGDTVTLIIIYRVVQLYDNTSTKYIFICLMVYIVIVLPVLYKLLKGTGTSHHLYSGWSAIFSALCLSSGAGLLLKKFVYSTRYLSTFQPLVNGIGGNMAAIFCSHLSSNLHNMKKNDKITEKHIEIESRKLLKVLIFIGVLVHILLVSVIRSSTLLLAGLDNFWEFLLIYLVTILGQISILLLLSKKFVLTLWNHGIDPDNASIPLATGFGDLLGTSLLCLTLSIL